MYHSKHSLFLCMFTTVLIALLLATQGAEAATLTCGVWRIVPSPSPGSSPSFSAVAAVSANDVWAVGSNGNPLTEHFNGMNWKVIPSPGSNGAALTGVAAVSTRDVWAVGNATNSSGIAQTLTEHWNGTSWQIVNSPNVGTSHNFLLGVAVVSANDIWAVGVYVNSGTQQTLTEHWNGTNWQIVNSPNVGSGTNFLYGVAAISAKDVWAVGNASNNGTGQTLIEHWNGANWQVVSSPSPGSGGNYLNGVAAISAKDVWAVGISISSRGIQQTLTEHWNGTSWQVIKSPNPGSTLNALEGVSVVSAHSVWAVGAFYNSKDVQQTLTEHWNGTSWQVVNSPNLGTGVNNALMSTAHVPGTGDTWAVGNTFFGEGSSQTITEFYC